MSYCRVDDGFPEHPKVERLSDRAFRLHVTALVYCNRNLTDGVMSEPAVKAMKAAIGATRRHVDELVSGGLWGRLTGGYEVHDFLQWNVSSTEVKARRQAAKERMAAFRSRERSLEHAGERSQNVPDWIGSKRKKHSLVCPDCGVGGGLHIADCANGPVAARG